MTLLMWNSLPNLSISNTVTRLLDLALLTPSSTSFKQFIEYTRSGISFQRSTSIVCLEWQCTTIHVELGSAGKITQIPYPEPDMLQLKYMEVIMRGSEMGHLMINRLMRMGRNSLCRASSPSAGQGGYKGASQVMAR